MCLNCYFHVRAQFLQTNDLFKFCGVVSTGSSNLKGSISKKNKPPIPNKCPVPNKCPPMMSQNELSALGAKTNQRFSLFLICNVSMTSHISVP